MRRNKVGMKFRVSTGNQQTCRPEQIEGSLVVALNKITDGQVMGAPDAAKGVAGLQGRPDGMFQKNFCVFVIAQVEFVGCSIVKLPCSCRMDSMPILGAASSSEALTCLKPIPRSGLSRVSLIPHPRLDPP